MVSQERGRGGAPQLQGIPVNVEDITPCQDIEFFVKVRASNLLGEDFAGVNLKGALNVLMIDPISASSSNQADTSVSDTWNYEATVERVETIIKQIEAGDLELAEVFEQFAAAVNYLRQCEVFLQERQQQMDLLIETLEEESDF